MGHKHIAGVHKMQYGKKCNTHTPLKHLISSQDSTALFALQWGVFVSCDFLAAKDPVFPS